MDLQLIHEHLSLTTHDSIGPKKVYDILLNLGFISKLFRELLMLSDKASHRALVLLGKDRIRVLNQKPSSSLPQLIRKFLSGTQIIVTDEEYFIIITLFLSEKIKPSYRTQLRLALGYSTGTSVTTQQLVQCNLCGSSTTKNLCSSCRNTLESFTEFRRESFNLPINFLNIPPLHTIEPRPGFRWSFMDWDISKEDNGTEVRFNLLQDVSIGMVQYQLPFVEEQRLITP